MTRGDAVLFFLLAAFTFGLCHHVAVWPPAAYHAPSAQDIWFDADTRRVFWVETDRAAKNDRASLHPIQRLVGYSPVLVLRRALKLSSEDAVRAHHAGIAAAWVGFFFLLLRRLGCRRPDALVFTAVAATSSSAVFWLPVTESFVAGSLTMFPALALAARPESARTRHYFAATFLSLGMTLTNGMAGLFVSFCALPWRRFAAVSAAAFAAIVACVLIDGAVFSGTRVLPGAPMDETAWIFSPDSGGPFAILRSFFVSGMVAPEMRFLENWKHPVWPVMTFQFGGLFSGTRWGWIATPAWTLLLGLGAWALWREKERPVLRQVLTLTLLYQLLLHLFYGRETFLYAIHFVPYLIAMAALAAQTRLRPVVLALGVLLAVTNGVNSARSFSWARAYNERHPALKKLEGITHQRVDGSEPPAIHYRFWRDTLGSNR